MIRKMLARRRSRREAFFKWAALYRHAGYVPDVADEMARARVRRGA